MFWGVHSVELYLLGLFVTYVEYTPSHHLLLASFAPLFVICKLEISCCESRVYSLLFFFSPGISIPFCNTMFHRGIQNLQSNDQNFQTKCQLVQIDWIELLKPVLFFSKSINFLVETETTLSLGLVEAMSSNAGMEISSCHNQLILSVYQEVV